MGTGIRESIRRCSGTCWPMPHTPTDGHWPLCSHFLYNITRWLKKKRKTLEQGEVPPLVDRVISGLDDLSAKASKSFRKRIAASEGITDVDALMAIAQAVEPDLSMWETK